MNNTIVHLPNGDFKVMPINPEINDPAIGYCECCGLLDHHRIHGLCAGCNNRAQTVGYEAADVNTIPGYRAGDKHPNSMLQEEEVLA